MPADEFDTIARLFAPLATSTAARGLLDDVAVLQTSGKLVVTTDTIVEGVHFLSEDPIESVAKKALRVNLSDLAAKGAKPIGVTVALMWPQERASADLEGFARGLGQDLDLFGIELLGGDTTSTPGPLAVSVTAFGAPFGERTPARADARVGDDVWVTGALGDAFLGYELLTGEWAEAGGARDYAIARYRTPQPRLSFAPAIARFASGSMDVSDGLLADGAKMARASMTTLCLDLAQAPVSDAGRAWIAGGGEAVRLFTWGDDYEILFCADPNERDGVAAAGAGAGVAVTRIGHVALAMGSDLVDPAGAAISGVLGHAHTLGR